MDWEFFVANAHGKALVCRPLERGGEKKEICLVDFVSEAEEPEVSSTGIVIDFEHSILVQENKQIGRAHV